MVIGQLSSGDYNTICFFCDKLLKPYVMTDASTRKVLIEEIERDLLQYRLLHRGYEKYYVTSGPTFLDDGYRIMASRIYASHVYMP